MAVYELTEAADADLQAIARYSVGVLYLQRLKWVKEMRFARAIMKRQ